jgi:hypothetical protein
LETGSYRTRARDIDKWAKSQRAKPPEGFGKKGVITMTDVTETNALPEVNSDFWIIRLKMVRFYLYVGEEIDE